MSFDLLAAILQTTEKNAPKRAAGLKLLPACGRCGGSGRYSFNGSHSICYGCGGAGQRAPKTEIEWSHTLEDASAAMSDGRFDRYMLFLDAMKQTKAATDRIMAAWKATGISGAYCWRKAADFSRTGNPAFKRDRDLADINAKMAHAYQRVSDASFALNSSKSTYQEDIIALARLVDEALETVEQAEAEMNAYLEAA